MLDIASFDDLKARQRAIRDGFPSTMALRVHRAISWIGRAEASLGDNDARFIFLWIALNASYADEEELALPERRERDRLSTFFDRVCALDAEKRIYKAVWTRFSGPVRVLMENNYLFGPFWQHHNGVEGNADWPDRFAASARVFASAFKSGDTPKVLDCVFGRLYMLRNQLVHGGATWNSGVNRAQVRDGAEILATLMPIFVEIMMDHPEADWGRPFYPVVEG